MVSGSVLSWLLLFGVLAGLLHLTANAWRSSYTYDEPWHIRWNSRYVEHQETERESFPNYNSTTPILSPGIWLIDKVIFPHPLPSVERKFLRRCAHSVWFFAALLSVYWAARMIAGKAAGVLAALAVSLDPTVIAHAGLLTTDVPFAASVMAAIALFLFFQRKPNVVRACMLGLGVGLCISAKFSFVIVMPVLLLALCVFLIRCTWYSKAHRFILLAVGLLSALLAINLAYGFQHFAEPLSLISFRSPPFTTLSSLIPWLRFPLPSSLLQGLDRCMAVERSDMWNVILQDTWYPKGTWRYFPIVALLKTPISLLIFYLGGIGILLRDKLWSRDSRIFWLGFIWLTSSVYFVFFFRTQVGFRYVLFLLPLTAVLCAVAWSKTSIAIGPRVLKWFIVLPLLEIAPYTGNLLTFTNLLIADENVYTVFADSNLDWGQNRDSHRGFKEFFEKEGWHLEPLHVLPGVNAFSVNELVGVWWNHRQHRWLRDNLKPYTIIDHTLFLYEIEDAEFQRFLDDERSLASRFTPSCQDGTESLDEKRTVTLSSKRQGRICLKADKPSTIKVTSPQYSFWLGPQSSWGGCDTEQVHRGREAWYRLESGLHGFCFGHEGEWQAKIEVMP